MVEGLQTDPVRLPLGGILALLVALLLGGLPAFLLLSLAVLAALLREMVQIPQQGLTLRTETLLQLTHSGARGVLGRK